MSNPPENTPGVASRFFTNFLKCLAKLSIPDKQRRWYVKHIEAFIRAQNGRKIKSPDRWSDSLFHCDRPPKLREKLSICAAYRCYTNMISATPRYLAGRAIVFLYRQVLEIAPDPVQGVKTCETTQRVLPAVLMCKAVRVVLVCMKYWCDSVEASCSIQAII